MIWILIIYIYILIITKQGTYLTIKEVTKVKEGVLYGRKEIPKVV